MAGFGQVRSEVYDRVSRSQYYRDNLAGLTAHQRHQRLLAELKRGEETQPADAAAALGSTVSDEDVLRQHHRFLRTAADDALEDASDWGVRLAKRYYARLFKEYAIADLSRYQQSKVGMRWRTKEEVMLGKGQFTCGAKGCNATAGLASYEVNFSYVEAGSAKQALVKLRLCDACAAKLNYRREKQYKKLARLPAEDEKQQQQRGRCSDADEEQQQRKQKRRGRSRDRAMSSGSEEGVRADMHQSSSSSRKRRHRSHDTAAQQQQGLKSAHLAATAAEGDGGSDVRRQGAAVLQDADIDRWLDSMFTNA